MYEKGLMSLILKDLLSRRQHAFFLINRWKEEMDHFQEKQCRVLRNSNMYFQNN